MVEVKRGIITRITTHLGVMGDDAALNLGQLTFGELQAHLADDMGAGLGCCSQGRSSSGCVGRTDHAALHLAQLEA